MSVMFFYLNFFQGPGTKEDGYLAYYEICNFVLGTEFALMSAVFFNTQVPGIF
jgi:hypothetical protein